MAPARSLRATLSQVSASFPTFDGSIVSRAKPTARSWVASGEAAAPRPCTTRSLWQVTQ